jgi:hypothetical protein
MTVFWDVQPCGLVELTDVSEELTASIIRAMSTHRRSISKRLQGATFQKKFIFILAAMGTSNLA